ncbi:hypothetical protein [Nitrincola tapanii]|uniref:Uncharacterized protein n=1 Tax=Nitrincola tapanii TaxID=1708751 RepID=A0A5A9W3Y5_9GAMM|nr:hypothetical protein [Nitrincola tapanii]KAA0875480.1 hypothetical protein E1H14_05735 [Nitrincola tapanii]
MSSDLLFRCREIQRFLKAIILSAPGRRILWRHLLNSLVLTAMILSGLLVAFFGFFEGFLPRRRTLLACFSALYTFLVIMPLATMPFFSFKDLFDRLAQRCMRRRLFYDLSQHVFYRTHRNGQISLHLAKAHSLLAEKHHLLSDTAGRTRNISRHLAGSLARSIREAVHLSRQLVGSGKLKPDQKITGATYSYLFGAAKSKLGLKRCQPSGWSGWLSGVFYRYGALHAVFMYFVIHDQLPPEFDPVYFMAQVSDVIGEGSKSS